MKHMLQAISCALSSTYNQALEKIFTPLEKCVGHSLKLLDIVKKFGPLSENASTPLVSQAGYRPAYNHCIFWWPTDPIH